MRLGRRRRELNVPADSRGNVFEAKLVWKAAIDEVVSCVVLKGALELYHDRGSLCRCASGGMEFGCLGQSFGGRHLALRLKTTRTGRKIKQSISWRVIS